jgi:hypothetical protein
LHILHAWLKICRKSSILPIRPPKIKNNRNRNVKYNSLQNSVFKLAYHTSEKNHTTSDNSSRSTLIAKSANMDRTSNDFRELLLLIHWNLGDISLEEGPVYWYLTPNFFRKCGRRV